MRRVPERDDARHRVSESVDRGGGWDGASLTAFPKPRPHILIKREQRAAKTALDTQERKACHVRSGGRCEVVEVLPQPERSLLIVTRCKGRAVHNHHLISGVGRRNVGVSVLASH